MKFSAQFGLNHVQAELDFVDVELDRDTPLFLDPYSLRTRADDFSAACARSITVYFEALLRAIRAKEYDEARRLLAALHEPNETRLGLSRGKPKGSAIGSALANDILESMRTSEAVRTGLIEDLSESELFVDGIGADRISDLTTNILRGDLLRYTKAQCDLHGIPTTNVPAGAVWDLQRMEWVDQYAEMPVANSGKILLVPKSTVRWKPSISHAEYYNDFVINFLRRQELEKPGSTLIRLLKSSGERKIYKKDVKSRFPVSKGFLQTFSEEHPEILEEYRRAKAGSDVLSSTDLDEGFDETVLARQLIVALNAIPAGDAGALRYHHLMIGILEFIFYPNLIYPKKEQEINEGRKRIDITYVNHAQDGLFARFTATTRRPANVIMVECKNYTKDVANPELDQLAGRFADHRGWLGLLTCRQIDNKGRLLQRCNDSARDGHGFIIPLDDADIVALLEHIERGDRQAVMVSLDERFRRLTV